MQLIPYYRAAWKAKAFQLCSLFYAYLRINLLGQSNKVEVFGLGNSKFMAAYIYINIYVCVYTKKERESAHLAIGKQRGCHLNLSE